MTAVPGRPPQPELPALKGATRGGSVTFAPYTCLIDEAPARQVGFVTYPRYTRVIDETPPGADRNRLEPPLSMPAVRPSPDKPHESTA